MNLQTTMEESSTIVDSIKIKLVGSWQILSLSTMTSVYITYNNSDTRQKLMSEGLTTGLNNQLTEPVTGRWLPVTMATLIILATLNV